MSASPAAAPAPLVFQLGSPATPESGLSLGLPVLAGDAAETLFAPATLIAPAGEFHLARSGPWLVGWAAPVVRPDLAAQTRELYAGLFAATAGEHLCRIWHYIPAINATTPAGDGLENYRAFSRGRSLAFEDAYGAAFHRHLPAASAVGTDRDRLIIIFAAAAFAPQHVENPLQIPAYDYPPEHGPRAPSFARASTVVTPAGRAVFISGTSAIRGHGTVAPGDTAAQLACTVENLRTVARSCGLGETLATGPGGQRFFKVYLRHASDTAATARQLTQTLLQPGDHVTYVRSDICRAALNIEIEATLFGVG